MGDQFLGEIRMFAGNFAPRGWALCNGQLLAISENDALFALIGTIYGGDGQSTFALPDLRGRLPVHQFQGPGLSNYVIGQQAGVETVTLTNQQLPVHTHGFGVINGQPGNQANPTGALPAMSLSITPYINDAATGSFDPAAITSAGGGQPHNNLQPSLCVNFTIALEGIFPSQS